jgi:hypothetical protein
MERQASSSWRRRCVSLGFGLAAVTLLACGCGQGSSSSQASPTQTPSEPDNHAPVAAADSATVAEDAVMEVGVLDNDSDPDDDPLSVSVQTAPQHGTAVVIAAGAIRYTPLANFSGADSLQYEVNDGHGGTASALLSLQVTAEPDAPTARDDMATVVFSGSVDIDVLANDDDSDGDSLSLSSVTAPSHGTATVLQSGRVRYSADDGYSGPDQFSYTVSDDTGRTATARIDIDVGSAPANSFLTTLQGRGTRQLVAHQQEPVPGRLDARRSASEHSGLYEPGQDHSRLELHGLGLEPRPARVLGRRTRELFRQRGLSLRCPLRSLAACIAAERRLESAR